jgi:carboxyl-terminal processing protease
VTRTSSPEDLFRILTEMIDLLADPHVTLQAGEREHHAAWPDPIVMEDGRPAPRYPDYLAEHSPIAGLTFGANRRLAWRKAAPEIGYLAVFGFARLGGDGMKAQVEVFERALDQAFVDLQRARGLIVDLRFNGGGYDAAALALVSRLISERRVGLTKSARHGDGFTPAYPVWAEPSQGPRFAEGPVLVLIGENTASAAEVALLPLLDNTRIKRMGQTTLGVFSDTQSRTLPNGWTFTVSNEVYRAPDGQLHEVRGIPAQLPTSPGGSWREIYAADLEKGVAVMKSWLAGASPDP